VTCSGGALRLPPFPTCNLPSLFNSLRTTAAISLSLRTTNPFYLSRIALISASI
jgi:hypothetical protein